MSQVNISGDTVSIHQEACANDYEVRTEFIPVKNVSRDLLKRTVGITDVEPHPAHLQGGSGQSNLNYIFARKFNVKVEVGLNAAGHVESLTFVPIEHLCLIRSYADWMRPVARTFFRLADIKELMGKVKACQLTNVDYFMIASKDIRCLDAFMCDAIKGTQVLYNPFSPIVWSKKRTQRLFCTFHTYFNKEDMEIEFKEQGYKWSDSINEMLWLATNTMIDEECDKAKKLIIRVINKRGQPFIKSQDLQAIDTFITNYAKDLRSSWYRGSHALAKIKWSCYNLGRAAAIYSFPAELGFFWPTLKDIGGDYNDNYLGWLRAIRNKLFSSCMVCGEDYVNVLLATSRHKGKIRVRRATRIHTTNYDIYITRRDRDSDVKSGFAPILCRFMDVYDIWITRLGRITWNCKTSSNFQFEYAISEIRRYVPELFPGMVDYKYHILFNDDMRTWEHPHLEISFISDNLYKLNFPLFSGTNTAHITMGLDYVGSRILITLMTLLARVYYAHAEPLSKNTFFGNRPVVMPLPITEYIHYVNTFNGDLTRSIMTEALTTVLYLAWDLSLPSSYCDMITSDYQMWRNKDLEYEDYPWEDGIRPTFEWLFAWWCRHHEALNERPIYQYFKVWILNSVGYIPMSQWICSRVLQNFLPKDVNSRSGFLIPQGYAPCRFIMFDKRSKEKIYIDNTRDETKFIEQNF
jgi:hypothetical protein